MPTNIYVTAYPLSGRTVIDETLAHLTQYLSGHPLSYLQFYSLVASGKQSKLSRYDLQRKTLGAIVATNAKVRIDYRELRHLIGYQGPFHGTTAPDGKQIYVLGIQRPEAPSVRDKALLELATVGNVFMETVPGLDEYSLGLTLWRLDFSSRQMAEAALKNAEKLLERRGLKVVSSVEDFDL